MPLRRTGAAPNGTPYELPMSVQGVSYDRCSGCVGVIDVLSMLVYVSGQLGTLTGP
jgi:hypothetical protein